MTQRRIHIAAVGEHAVCLGMLVCAVIFGVMAAGCSSLPFNETFSSFEEEIVITPGEGHIGLNSVSYPVTVKNIAVIAVGDVRLNVDLLDVTGGGETVVASKEIEAGSFDPKEERVVTVDFKLIKTAGKDFAIRVTRVK